MAKKEAVEKVVEMKKQGIPVHDIVDDLRKQGFSYQESEDAMNQAEFKSSSQLQPSIMEEESTNVPPPEMPSQPEREEESISEPVIQPQQFIPTQPVKSEMENVEVLIENIVEEKWKRMMENYGDILSWKEKVRTEIIAVKQELLRLRTRLENTEQAILGRVTQYDKDIIEMGSDVKALEKVLQNILKPLTSSIKELQEVTRKLKK